MIYPELAKLMAIKRMTQTDLGKVIGRTQQATSKKLNGETDFKKKEMQAIKEHFKDVIPDINMDAIFEENIFLP